MEYKDFFCSECNDMSIYANGLCKKCYMRKRYEYKRKLSTCTILKQHHEELRDDPEHLTTDFIQGLIGVKC